MSKLSSLTVAAALVAAIAWTVKVAVIGIRDASFDPAEGVVFMIGLLALVVAGVSLARDLLPLRRAVARWTAAIPLGLALVAGLMVVQAVAQSLVSDAYSGGNLAVEEEAGILLVALMAGALGLAGAVGRRAPNVATDSTAPSRAG